MLKKSLIISTLIILPMSASHAQSRLAGLLESVANFSNAILSQVGGATPLMNILDRFAPSNQLIPQTLTNADTNLQPLGYYSPDKSKAYTVGDLPMSNPNTPMTCANSLSVSGGNMEINTGTISCSNSTNYSLPIASGNTITR